MGKIATAIKEKLQTAFNPSHLDVIDESHKHTGHAGAKAHLDVLGSGESHFHVVIISDAFHGMNRLVRHRAVMDVLSEEIMVIHAFSLEASAN
ncbi:MAG: BolA family transcriptional regulator [Hyphomonadaceae bacterium]|nr:BolA family transcriptional regulator [Hyphomonadaceae bacterium]MBC6412186.1 BolA family transcriptional regulator [Hyphomonadaceae bacterium]